MSKNLPDNADSVAGDIVEKLRRSWKRLLDLTLRNRLLNFRPGKPYRYRWVFIGESQFWEF